MKVIVIDRDRENCDQMLEAFAAARIEAVSAPTRNAAVQMYKEGGFDAIFMDPVPQTNEIRPFVIGVRRSTGQFPPIVVVGHPTSIGMSVDELQKVGCNDFLAKPFNSEQVLEKARNAQRIVQAARMMADDSDDFPSADGIIAKSAFNQLFITCLDRADRYGEHSYVIYVDLENLAEIEANDGKEAADLAADNLRKAVSRTRRLSDIAGHVGRATFCLLLLRPPREDEPFLAANRFAEALAHIHEGIPTTQTKPVVKISLLAVPTGEMPLEHVIGPAE